MEKDCLNCKEIEIVDLEFNGEEKILTAFCKYCGPLDEIKPCEHYQRKIT